MTKTIPHSWALVMLGALLAAIIATTVAPYNWNITALFHMDATTAARHPLPKNFVVLASPSYDGAQYYQIARNIPRLIQPALWPQLRREEPGSYAYQRFLLPLAAFTLSLGQEALLPYAFLFINIVSLLATCLIILRWRHGKPLYALALALCPAAMVALSFSLAEPLTILLITITLTRLVDQKRIDPVSLICLGLVVLAREVNILFILYLIGFSILQCRGRSAHCWKDVMMLFIPIIVFLLWHAAIYRIFGNVPFLMSAGAHQLPGSAAWELISGARGYDRYTLSAIVLLIGFVLPATFWSVSEVIKTRGRDVLSLGAFAFLGLMLIMPDYIWGSVTSIGRVITPVYPLVLLAASERDTWAAKMIALSVLVIGLLTALGLAMSVHPMVVTV